MMKRTLIMSLVLVLFLIPLARLPLRPAAAQGPAAEILQRVNALRASLGLPAFQVHPTLAAVAQAHAEWMAAQGTFSHTGAGGTSPQQRVTNAGYQGWVAENIVGGSLMDPARGVEWWRNSPIHYATLSSTRYVDVGVGYAYGAGMHMYVLVAGYTSSSAPANNGNTNGGNTAGNGAGNAANDAPPPPAVVIPVEIAEPREDGSVVHVVQAGQTAWDIAAVYEVPLADILRLNRLPETPLLVPGDEVIVRPSPHATPVPEGPILYTVRDGDTAWTIAIRYDVALEDLLILNNLPNDPILLPGEDVIVWLPEGMAPPTPDRPTTYTVRPGDTLWQIAANHRLTMAELLAMNDLSEDAVLLPDTVLVVWQAPTPTQPPPSVEEETATPTRPAQQAVAQQATPGREGTIFATDPPTDTPTPTRTQPQPPTQVAAQAGTPTPPPPQAEEESATPEALPAGGGVTPGALLGLAVIGLGVLVLAGFVGVEVYERLRRGRG